MITILLKQLETLLIYVVFIVKILEKEVPMIPKLYVFK